MEDGGEILECHHKGQLIFRKNCQEVRKKTNIANTKLYPLIGRKGELNLHHKMTLIRSVIHHHFDVLVDHMGKRSKVDNWKPITVAKYQPQMCSQRIVVHQEQRGGLR